MQVPAVMSEAVQCTAGATNLDMRGCTPAVGQEHLGEDDGTHNLTHSDPHNIKGQVVFKKTRSRRSSRDEMSSTRIQNREGAS